MHERAARNCPAHLLLDCGVSNHQYGFNRSDRDPNRGVAHERLLAISTAKNHCSPNELFSVACPRQDARGGYLY
jgi:hypothetical protein